METEGPKGEINRGRGEPAEVWGLGPKPVEQLLETDKAEQGDEQAGEENGPASSEEEQTCADGKRKKEAQERNSSETTESDGGSGCVAGGGAENESAGDGDAEHFDFVAGESDAKQSGERTERELSDPIGGVDGGEGEDERTGGD